MIADSEGSDMIYIWSQLPPTKVSLLVGFGLPGRLRLLRLLRLLLVLLLGIASITIRSFGPLGSFLGFRQELPIARFQMNLAGRNCG